MPVIPVAQEDEAGGQLWDQSEQLKEPLTEKFFKNFTKGYSSDKVSLGSIPSTGGKFFQKLK